MFVADNGILQLETKPSGLEIFMMLPFPFFCTGCCFSLTSQFTFNDNTQKLHYWSYPGYLSFIRKDRIIDYQDIGNVCYYRTNVAVDEVWLYQPALMLKSGELLRFGAKNYDIEITRDVLGLHYFLFGRNNPAYEKPHFSLMLVEK